MFNQYEQVHYHMTPTDITDVKELTATFSVRIQRAVTDAELNEGGQGWSDAIHMDLATELNEEVYGELRRALRDGMQSLRVHFDLHPDAVRLVDTVFSQIIDMTRLTFKEERESEAVERPEG